MVVPFVSATRTAEAQTPSEAVDEAPPCRGQELANTLLALSDERGQEHETNARQEHCVGSTRSCVFILHQISSWPRLR